MQTTSVTQTHVKVNTGIRTCSTRKWQQQRRRTYLFVVLASTVKLPTLKENTVFWRSTLMLTNANTNSACQLWAGHIMLTWRCHNEYVRSQTTAGTLLLVTGSNSTSGRTLIFYQISSYYCSFKFLSIFLFIYFTKFHFSFTAGDKNGQNKYSG